MSEPRPTTKCQRCGHEYARHHDSGGEGERQCPLLARTIFRRRTAKNGASQSFSPAEIAELELLVSNAMRCGGNRRVLVTLRRKVLVMRASSRARERQRLADGVQRDKRSA
jgi:hypothetical protein